jgi:hypothetical protein
VPLSYVLSILAIMISLASAIATIVLWRMSGPRLKVRLSTVILVGDERRAALHLQVTNVGRASTIVQRWHLASRSSTAWISATSGWNQGPGTPKKLETHETVNWYLDYHEVRSKLLREHPSERHALQAVVTYGGGTARSKATTTISDSPSDSTPSLAKRVTMDFTNASVFAVFVAPIGATGRSDFSLVVQNCGLAPIRMAQVDLVTDEGRESNPSGRIERRRWLLPRRTWRLPLARLSWPDDDRGSEVWVRLRWVSVLGKHGELRLGSPPINEAVS